MTQLQTITAGTGADTLCNENFEAVSQAAIFSKDPVTTTGLTWGFKGGQYNGAALADGTVPLTASTTNYVVANKATGAVSVSTATTNWNDATNYIQLYSVVAGASTVTSYTDCRQFIGMSSAALTTVSDLSQNTNTTSGLTYGYNSGQVRQSNTVAQVAAGTVALTASTTNYVEVTAAGAVSANTVGFTYGNCPMAVVVTGSASITSVADRRAPFMLPDVLLNKANNFGKGQTVAPVVNAAVTGTYTPDASLSNNFELTLTGNTTIANPTNLTHGQVINICLDQDATGGRTIAFGTMFKFAQTVSWSTAANAKNFLSAYYDGTVLRCGGGAGYA